MRVVSQNGNVDFPYESIVVIHASDRVAIKHNENDYIVAEYSSNEKAYKAMEMLREAYRGKLQRTKSGNVMIDFTANQIFQFPKDEDLEVEDET